MVSSLAHVHLMTGQVESAENRPDDLDSSSRAAQISPHRTDPARARPIAHGAGPARRGAIDGCVSPRRARNNSNRSAIAPPRGWLKAISPPARARTQRPHGCTARPPRPSRMFASKPRKEVKMNKARLISLMVSLSVLAFSLQGFANLHFLGVPVAGSTVIRRPWWPTGQSPDSRCARLSRRGRMPCSAAARHRSRWCLAPQLARLGACAVFPLWSYAQRLSRRLWRLEPSSPRTLDDLRRKRRAAVSDHGRGRGVRARAYAYPFLVIRNDARPVERRPCVWRPPAGTGLSVAHVTAWSEPIGTAAPTCFRRGQPHLRGAPSRPPGWGGRGAHRREDPGDRRPGGKRAHAEPGGRREGAPLRRAHACRRERRGADDEVTAGSGAPALLDRRCARRASVRGHLRHAEVLHEPDQVVDVVDAVECMSQAFAGNDPAKGYNRWMAPVGSPERCLLLVGDRAREGRVPGVGLGRRAHPALVAHGSAPRWGRG